MAKRFTDSNKWDKIWFRKLTPVHKCLWFYICDRCDHAGIWEVDLETASYFIGEIISLDETEKVFEKQFIRINNGSRWIIKDFLVFQYGQYDEKNKMFKPIQSSLNKHGVSMGDIWGIYPLKVQVQVKEKVKVKVQEKVKDNKEKIQKFDFQAIWNKYPNKDGRKAAEQSFHVSVLTDLDYKDIHTALNNYLSSKKVASGYIKNGSTWFNNWRDWVEFKDDLCKLCRGRGKYTSKTGYEIICSCPAGVGK